MSLAEAAYFIGASIDPELALTAGAQLVILSNQPGVGVKCIAMQCPGGGGGASNGMPLPAANVSSAVAAM